MLIICSRPLDSLQLHKYCSYHKGIDYSLSLLLVFKLVVSIQVTLELPDLNYTYARVPPQRLI